MGGRQRPDWAASQLKQARTRFLKKARQKRLIPGLWRCHAPGPRSKGFLLLFFKKEALAYLLTLSGYIPFMKILLMILLGADLIAVVAVMLFGAIGMANANRSPQMSNKLMRWRVGLQGFGVLLVVLLMLTGGR
jgi:hypothetical protein